MATSVMCRCGHGRETHEHFRSGSDCGICGTRSCHHFRRPGWRRALLAAEYLDTQLERPGDETAA
jgi:hypothetical protein